MKTKLQESQKMYFTPTIHTLAAYEVIFVFKIACA